MKKQIFALGISLIVNMFCLHSFSQTQIIGMTATASTNDYGPASYAVDGNAISSWQSARYATGQWLQLNLPFGYGLSSLEIDWGGPYNNCTVQLYNAAMLVGTFTVGNNGSNGSNQSILTFTGSSSQPITMIKINADTYGPTPIIINEVKVLGTYQYVGVVSGINATASSSNNGAASNAVDGNTSTAWGSTSGATGQWLQLSLPGLYHLSSVQITWGLPYNNCTVQFYNGANLVQTYSPGANTGNSTLLSVPPTTSPVNKIVITSDASMGSAPVSIYEVVVSGYAAVTSTFDFTSSSSANVGYLSVGGTSTGSTSLALQTSAATNGYSTIQSTKSIGTAGGGVLAINPDGGNVGIGTTNPQGKLHIANGDVILQNQTTGYPILWLKDVSGTNNVRYDYNSIIHSGDNFSIRSGANYKLILNDDGGNVLIGKTTQVNTAYKLDVAGSIRANEVKINMDGADFVFAPTFKLRPLAEVETFIKANKHLPDVSSAADMQVDGVSVSELQTKLLQKIEELTLYSIEQEKTIKELKKQAKENAELKQEIKELKELVMKKLK